MKKLAAIVFLGLVASMAYAQTPHYLDMFFTADPTEFGTIPVSVVPTAPSGPYTLSGGANTWLALWGKSSGQWQSFTTTYKVGPSTKTWVYTDWVGDIWQSVAVNFVDAGGVLVQADSYCDNPATVGNAPPPLRWLAESHFTWNSAGVGGGFNVATLSDRGLGGTGVDSTGHPTGYFGKLDNEQIADVRTTTLNTPGNLYSILGYAHIVDTAKAYPKNVFFTVGTGTIGRRDGTANFDYVRFGTSTQILGKNFLTGDKAMLTIVPEPASLLLLGVAALALRRR